jgi:murein DD-endopeptidase MepM/ murein hydrolase activator NlpD
MSDATARILPFRPPDWDWSFPADGTLALKPQSLKNPGPFATVPAMSPPVEHRRASSRRATTPRRRHLERERRLRRLAVLIAIAIVALATLLLSAFGGSGSPAQAPTAPASASRLMPAGPPRPEIVAKLGSLHLQLPISQSRVTAIGYQGGSDGALALDPLGTQVNQGLLRRVGHAIFGGSSGRPRWYQLPGGQGPALSAIDIGASAGTDVYSPVDGTVASIGDVQLNGRVYGSRIDIQPTAGPSAVVSVSHVRVDPSLVVGSSVTAAVSKLGSVVDFSHAERQALARHTNDSGNHVVVEVHPAATLSLG